MKKGSLLFTIIICVTRFSFGQTYTGQFYAPNSVGMHTDSYFNLIPNSGATSVNSWNIDHLDGSSLFSVFFAAAQPSIQIGMAKSTNFYVNGNVGIGTTTPQTKLHVTGDLTFDGSGNPNIFTGTGSAELNRYVFLLNSPSSQSASGLKAGGILVSDSYSFGNPGKNDLIVKGNVGIGTSIPDQKLTVKGIVHAQEVRVDLSVPGPDYVFEKNYKLPTLDEIKTYIDQNRHLPEVPSAGEMARNGVQLGEMNMLLLKKVEELTLYVIELKKENHELRSRMEKIENKN